MPNLFIRILMCLSSYFPLTVIFAIQFIYKGQRWAGICFLAIGLVGLIGMSVYLKYIKRLNPMPVDIENINRRDGEAMSYIVTYLLPFIALPNGTIADGLSLGVFCFVLVVLYINSDMLHINPILNLSGWHIYEIVLSTGEVHSFISRKRLRKGRKAMVIQMGEDIFLEEN